MSYIRKAEPKWVEGMVGGPGKVYNRPLINGPEDLYNSGRLFAHNVLEKDCGVGYHTHQGECEFYYILKGTPEYTDNGEVITLHPGDITYTGSGGQTATYRQSRGSKGNSGDYNLYPDTQTLPEQNATLKGQDGLYTLALWTDGTYAYSLRLSSGLSADAWQALLDGPAP